MDRDVFNVTYVLLEEQKGHAEISKFTKVHPSDRRRRFKKEEGDQNNGVWTTQISKSIEGMELDIIFYFEFSMSSWERSLGMQRLASGQLNSFGHPITSGAPRSVV